MRRGERFRRADGFTYITVLGLVAVLSAGLAVAAPRWSDAMQREREDELLRIGQLYAQAIVAYHEASPGSVKQYPASLSDLLVDTRYVGTRRHLRRLYADPMRPGQPFEVIKGADGTVRGVYSASESEPIRRSTLRFERMAEVPPATQYRQWKFIAEPKS